ncbi:HXXXD-type acyl-transferase family protein [Striga hermonthica]|uniref:HXXXD-type acyl-transferase family protein n=1 Tax=Striga hermonthica TaxID=68872 RepID=A0A9N7NAS6_STRHE|nr:HXXXD-type acyl-transferase family protein [Striga hermonthica]
MSRKFVQIKEVDDKTSAWTAIVQVVEKSHIQRGKPPKNVPYRRYLLTDSDGTKVSAVVYSVDLGVVSKKLVPYRRYYVSNAIVSAVDPKYQVSDYAYKWNLKKSTLIEPYEEPIPPQFPCHIEIQQFQNLYQFADTENLQNIMGVVVHALPVKGTAGSKTRDIVIVNEEKRPMLFTLWNEFEENEGVQLSSTIPTGNIVLAMRIKVTTFNSLSLTTRLPTCILINPPMQEAINLKQWYIDHKTEVARLIEDNAFANTSILLPPPNGNDVITVQAALRSLNKTVKATWVQGQVTMVTNQKSLWFSACGHCHTKLEVPVGWEMKCTICNGTGVLNALIYAEDAEKLIPFTAQQIYEAEKEGNDLLSEIITGFWKKTITCFIRHYESDYGYTMDSYAIVKLYLEDEIHGEARQHARMEKQIAAEEHLITPTGSQIPFAGDDSPYFRMGKGAENQPTGSSTKRKLTFSGPSDSKDETDQEKSPKQLSGTSNVEQKAFNPKKPHPTFFPNSLLETTTRRTIVAFNVAPLAKAQGADSSEEARVPRKVQFMRLVAPAHAGHRRPLLAVQVTELSGAVFVGCAANHAVVDGTSFWNFFNTFAHVTASAKQITRPPPATPSFRRDTVFDSPAVLPLPDGGPSATFSGDEPLREKIFHFSRESILRLKARANGPELQPEILGKQRNDKDTHGKIAITPVKLDRMAEISSFQSLSAQLWRSVTRARNLPAEKTTTFRMAVNCRHRLEPRLDPLYFGNAIQSIPTVAAVGEVLSNRLGWVAERLHRNVVAHDDLTVRAGVKEWEENPRLFPLGNFDGAMITMGSSPRFPMYDNDFGWGRPMAVRSGRANKFDGKISAFPGREGDGSVDLEVVLAPETMAGLENDLEFMQYVS